MISMQFVQVRSQNRSVPIGVGDMAKISYEFLFFWHFMILSQFFVMLVLPVCLSSTAKLISLL